MKNGTWFRFWFVLANLMFEYTYTSWRIYFRLILQFSILELPNLADKTKKEIIMEEKNVDQGGFLWGALGCCIPVVGLVLFLVWKDQKPKTAKAAGIGALVSVGISVVFYIAVLALNIGIATML